MTLKYMQLLGSWDEQLKPLTAVLHVPVDSYILEAIWHENKVCLPCYNMNPRCGKYGDSKVVSWSRWNADMYTKFQSTLRSYVRDCTNCESPLDWEGLAWIEIAQNHNRK